MDDETRQRLDALDKAITDLGNLIVDKVHQDRQAIVQRLNQQDLQLQAIVTRLDEQDHSLDRLMGKVDRLGVLARAGEEAMTSLDALAKRVAKLEAARRGEL
jgi:exonuclease VII small subunit